MSQRRVLILGANGRFGAAAAHAFAAAGYEVLAHARKPPSDLPPGTRHLDAPLSATATLVDAARGAATVVYAINPPYPKWHTDVLPLARQGMDIAEGLGATFVLPGNVYNFGTTMPALLQEATPHNADTNKGKIRVQLEAEMSARAGMRSIVLRAGDFFGASGGTWFDQAILRTANKGKLAYPGSLDVPHAWAFLPDLASACVKVVEAPRPAHAVYHFAGHTLTGHALLDALEQGFRRRGLVGSGNGTWKRTGMPWPLFRALGLVVPLWREILEMRYLWEVPHALDGSKLDALGITHTPLAQAIDGALDALQFARMSKAPARAAAA